MKQTQRVLALLRSRGERGVNPVDFQAPTVDGGKPILRLAARIRDLQDEGFGITSRRRVNGTSDYFLGMEAPTRAEREEADATLRAHRGAESSTGDVQASLFTPTGREPVNATMRDWDAA